MPSRARRSTRVFKLILENNLAQPAVYVHRDFMPRNLMVVRRRNPGRARLPGRRVRADHLRPRVAAARRLHQLGRGARARLDGALLGEGASAPACRSTPDFGEFYRDFEWMGLQRHLKVLGIFARLNYRDGKSSYLEDTPRFIEYVRAVPRPLRAHCAAADAAR